MNRRMILLVVAALLLPLLLRFVWFFPGFSLPRSIATPDYANIKEPQAPVSTPAAVTVKQLDGTVLFDYAHGNQFQPAEVQSLTDALTQRGGHFVLDLDPLTFADQLKSAKAYVVISPGNPFTPEQLALINAFVAGGGRLLVFTDATRGSVQYDYAGNPVGSQPDTNVTNPLLEPFGITVNADYLYDLDKNEGNFRNVYLTPSGRSDLTAGLSKIVFYGSHSVSTDSGSVLLAGGAGTLSSSTDAMPVGSAGRGWPAAVASTDGNVLAFGDFSFLAAPYDTVADNQLLIGNLADFLLGGTREPALADYPHLFRGASVNVLTTSGLQMTAEMTGTLSRLQGSLALAGEQVNVVQKPPSQGDLIVLGTYSPAEDLDKYVQPFGLSADDLGEYVTLPPFGKLGQSGTALLLFHPGSDGNTLVLLAASTDDMTSLIDALSSDGLTGCLIQGNVAACSIGFGGSFQETTPTPEATPLPGLTPIPGG